MLLSYNLYLFIQMQPFVQQDKKINAFQLIQTILLGGSKVDSADPILQLNIKMKDGHIADEEQLRSTLNLLKYPSTQLAQAHMKANRLGLLDLSIQDRIKYCKQDQNNSDKSDLEQGKNAKNKRSFKKICNCCGFLIQNNSLPYIAPLEKVKNIGISTYLYFLTIRHLALFLFIMLTTFSLAVLSTNLIGPWFEKCNNIDQKPFKFSFTIGNQLYYWLSFSLVLIWLFMFVYMKSNQKQAEFCIDEQSITASDFTLVFVNFPKGMSKQMLQEQLQSFQKKNGSLITHLNYKDVEIVKIDEGTPYYIYQSNLNSKQIQYATKEHKKKLKRMIDLLKERQYNKQFKTPKVERQQTYEQFKKSTEILQNLQEQAKLNIIQNKTGDSEATRPVFVTFKSIHNKNLIQKLHEQESQSLIYSLPKLSDRQVFHYQFKGQRILAEIQPAPEPEDIIWENLGLTFWEKVSKKLVTYFVAFLTLCLSCFIIYQFSVMKKRYVLRRSIENNKILQRIISLIMSITNVLIQQILRFLTIFEKNSTKTNEQMNLGMKAIFAVLFNSIMMPIIVNSLLQENIYGENGLAEDILNFSITNALLTPILKILNISFIKSRARFWYYCRPQSKMYITQQKLNQFSQYPVFQIGYQYIYIVNLFLFTCFFVPLNPFIMLPALISLFILYCAQKFAIFYCYRRPTPGDNSVHQALGKFILLGPIFFTAGSFCWVQNIGIYSNFNDNILLYTTIGISFLIMILPYKKLNLYMCSHKQEQQAQYLSSQLFLPSSYGRLNPITCKKDIISHKKSLQVYFKEQNDKEQQVKKNNLLQTACQIQLSKLDNQEETGQQLFAFCQKRTKQKIQNQEPLNKAEPIETLDFLSMFLGKKSPKNSINSFQKTKKF